MSVFALILGGIGQGMKTKSVECSCRWGCVLLLSIEGLGGVWEMGQSAVEWGLKGPKASEGLFSSQQSEL